MILNNHNIIILKKQMTDKLDFNILSGKKVIVDAFITDIIKHKEDGIIRFNVFTKLSKKIYSCQMSFIVPIQTGDSIYGEAILLNKTVNFTNLPFINNDNISEYQILEKLYMYFRNTPKNTCEKFLEWLKNKIPTDTSLLLFLDNICENYILKKDNTFVEEILKEFPYLSKNNIVSFLDFWFKDHLLRSLYLLGITKSEIKHSRISLVEFYSNVKKNPYTILNLSMVKCDQLSKQLRLNISAESRRCGEICRLLLIHIQDRKWTCTPLSSLYVEAPDSKKLLEELTNPLSYRCVVEYDNIYLPYQWKVESETAKMLNELINTETLLIREPIFPPEDIQPSDDQIEAIRSVLNNRVSSITGNAGSGKSTIIKWIVYNLEKYDQEYLICSFTGKAVSRLKDILPYSANKRIMTIHRSFKKLDFKFSYLILDESSMIETPLFYRQLLYYFNDIKNIVFIGDDKQLQPIGWGNLFLSILKSPKIPNSKLINQHRTNDNLLASNLAKIINKESVDNGDGFDIIFSSEEEIYYHVNNIYLAGEDFTVITPINKIINDINFTIRDIVNKDGKKTFDYSGREWRVGDRIMMTKNCYDINVMNGEEGKIVEVFDDSIKVNFRNSINKIPFYSRKNKEDEIFFDGDIEEDVVLSTNLIVLSWCIGVYKSQGSEWDNGIFYIPENLPASRFFCNNLVYTGTSRFKKSLKILGHTENYQKAIKIDPIYTFDNLDKRLI